MKIGKGSRQSGFKSELAIEIIDEFCHAGGFISNNNSNILDKSFAENASYSS
jgi:hypothetical protein